MEDPKHRKILITGGAGFIGSHLAERLSSQAQVVLFDNFRRDSLAYAPHLRDHPNVQVMQGDVLDCSTLREAMQGVDTLLHLAAIAGVSSYYDDPLNTLRVNTLGTMNALDVAVANAVRTVVTFSTSEIFGPDALGVTEESPASVGPLSDPRWVYAISKLAAEQATMHYGNKHGLAWSVVRPFNIYGPRQTGEGAISNFCEAVVSDKPLKIYGDGTAIRAWCYVSDLVDAVVAILSTPDASGHSFNIGNPHQIETTLGLAERVVRLEPRATLQMQPEQKRAEVRARMPVIDKARRMLGFEPSIDLDEGLRRTLAWFRVHRGVKCESPL